MLIICYHISGCSLSLCIGIAHSYANSYRCQHANVIAGISDSQYLLARNIQNLCQLGNGSSLVNPWLNQLHISRRWLHGLNTSSKLLLNQLDSSICLLWGISHNQHLWYMNIIFINILPHSLALHTAGLLIILRMLIIYNEIQLIITIEMNIQLALLSKIQQILNHCFIQIGSIKLLATSSLNESTIVGNNWHIQLQLLSIRQGGSIHSACGNSKDYPSLYSPLNHMLVALRNLMLIVEQSTIHICNK